MSQQVDWGAKPSSKKTPPAAPDLDRLVTGKGGLKRLNANIPEDVHADFKANATELPACLVFHGLKHFGGQEIRMRIKRFEHPFDRSKNQIFVLHFINVISLDEMQNFLEEF